MRGCSTGVALTGSRSSQPPDLGAGHTGTTPPKPLEGPLWLTLPSSPISICGHPCAHSISALRAFSPHPYIPDVLLPHLKGALSPVRLLSTPGPEAFAKTQLQTNRLPEDAHGSVLGHLISEPVCTYYLLRLEASGRATTGLELNNQGNIYLAFPPVQFWAKHFVSSPSSP